MPQQKHPWYEDFIAMLTGTLFVAFGVTLFNHHGLLTGGTAGLALLGTHVANQSFGTVFFVVNLPFYVLAYWQLGWRFTLRSFVAVTLVSVFADHMHSLVELQHINPWFDGVMGGLLIGMGLLIMFRHGASLGGVGVLALYLQHKLGWRAGKFQLAVDLVILGLSSLLFEFDIVMMSVLGSVAMNMVLAMNHKPGRYTSELTKAEPHSA